ncbi:recombinase family protein [Bradyrhizobium guangzhouense]|uniref:recombinase family protein n=1 Tax=Bradyrhizobium guangzhouense TaxID=1325095 RepID=UPI00100988E3|nr:recombinase family protein [Bradyrhizobium guangzhouense]RXH15218.1 recombinase family protein [Bradyrhizobium guangzhouense]
MANALIPREVRLPQVQHALRAAQYARMSTDHQRYSIDNQIAVIGAYALAHGISVVKTYKDEGESGLKIKNRDGLSRLIDDVRMGRADFKLILVYDVSRWGRFQDLDESAYYEFICKQAGIKVLYCAEQFENDGSLFSSVLKSLKRMMAAEFSRELSVKVHTGACRSCARGFRQGGRPCIGLRRQLLDEQGRSKGIMQRGQWKSLQSDRVVLCPGPPDEIELVKFIFRRFVRDHRSEEAIARELRARGELNREQRRWPAESVRYLLQNENYVGANVYNRRSNKLGTGQVRNPPAAWIRKENAFVPIIDRALFAEAQQILARRQNCSHLSNEEMLKRLRILRQRSGRLSKRIIDRAENVPSATLYQMRFGSLREAYRLIDYVSDRDCEYIASRSRRRNMIKEIGMKVVIGLAKSGTEVRLDQMHQTLRVQDTAISFRVARSWLDGEETHSPTWTIRRGQKLPPGLIVVIRLDASNEEILDYLLMNASELIGTRLRFGTDGWARFGARRFTTVSALTEVIKRRLRKNVDAQKTTNVRVSPSPA